MILCFARQEWIPMITTVNMTFLGVIVLFLDVSDDSDRRTKLSTLIPPISIWSLPYVLTIQDYNSSEDNVVKIIIVVIKEADIPCASSLLFA